MSDKVTRDVLDDGYLISELSLRQIGDSIKRVLPQGKGFALLVGTKPAARYIANCDRPGMIATIREVLLPAWELDT